MSGAVGRPQYQRVVQGYSVTTAAIQFTDEAPLDVVAHPIGSFVRCAQGSDGLHELPHAVVGKLGDRSFCVGASQELIRIAPGLEHLLILGRNQPRADAVQCGRGGYGACSTRIANGLCDVSARVVHRFGEVPLVIDLPNQSAPGIIEVVALSVPVVPPLRSQASQVVAGACDGDCSDAIGSAVEGGRAVVVGQRFDLLARRVVLVFCEVTLGIHRALKLPIAVVQASDGAILRIIEIDQDGINRRAFNDLGEADLAIGVVRIATVGSHESVRAWRQ
ncbi:hypothetical protein D3C71_911210 [compost metagenome]